MGAAASSSSFVNLLWCMVPIVAQGYARLLVSDASRQIRHVCTYTLNSSGTKFHWCYKISKSAMYDRVTLAGRFINSMASPPPHVKSSCEAGYSDGLHVYSICTGLVLIMMIRFCYLNR